MTDFDFLVNNDFNFTLGSAEYQEDLNVSSNGTTNLETGNPFLMPWWEQLLWSLLFGGMVAVATGGNLIVIWIVLADKRMRTVTNIFLVNLSIADTMVSTLNVVFNFVYMLSSDWPFGRLYCKISQFVAIISICASVFTLVAISFDRYVAIIYPLRPRMGRRTTILIVIWIWIASIGLAIPNFLFFTTEYLPDMQRTVCYGLWPDGPQSQSFMEYIHTVLLLVLTYALPMLVMAITYTRMGMLLWGSHGIGELTPNAVDATRSKRKVVKMMIVVVAIFGICWLPFHLYFIFSTQIPQINEWDGIQELYLAIYWLAMSNSMYNPMIYCWLNSRFRNGFWKVFRQICRCLPIPPGSPSVKRMQTTHCSYSYSPVMHNRLTANGKEMLPLRSIVSRNASNSKENKYLTTSFSRAGELAVNGDRRGQ